LLWHSLHYSFLATSNSRCQIFAAHELPNSNVLMDRFPTVCIRYSVVDVCDQYDRRIAILQGILRTEWARSVHSQLVRSLLACNYVLRAGHKH
ncbi:hypothetical protein PMAYCL1PPCAC_16153, partial [Pristionchus mayeri]